MAQRVFITGGAGYIGSILSEHLLDAGFAVTVLDNLYWGQQGPLHLAANSSFRFVRGDARDERLLRELIKDADILIPLAALVGAPACERNPEYAASVNRDAVLLLNSLRSPSQLIIFPNTNSGYGTKSGETFCTEETPLEPISLYGKLKTEAELALLATPNVITLRLATVFGMSPRPRTDLLVNDFVYKAVTDGYIVIFEKDFKRNYVHIRDVADGFIHAIRNAHKMKGKAYNLGLDDANLSKAELAEKIQRHVPKLYIHYAEIGSDPDKRNYIVSNERMRQAGFEARRSLDDGIRELIAGYAMLGRHPMKNI